MEAFKFSDNTFSVDIAGVTLKADAAEVELEISKCHKNVLEVCERVVSGGAEHEEIKKTITYVMNTLDNTFGNGISKAIFSSIPKISLHDCVDVLMYIIAGINEFESAKKDLYRSYKNKPQYGTDTNEYPER